MERVVKMHRPIAVTVDTSTFGSCFGQEEHLCGHSRKYIIHYIVDFTGQ